MDYFIKDCDVNKYGEMCNAIEATGRWSRIAPEKALRPIIAFHMRPGMNISADTNDKMVYVQTDSQDVKSDPELELVKSIVEITGGKPVTFSGKLIEL